MLHDVYYYLKIIAILWKNRDRIILKPFALQIFPDFLERALFYRGQVYFTLHPVFLASQPSLCANGYSKHCPQCRDPHCIIAGGFSENEMHELEISRESMWRPIQARFYNMGQLSIKRRILKEEVPWLSPPLARWLNQLIWTPRNWERAYNKRGDEK